jgi:SAM-dependent methyltransferase
LLGETGPHYGGAVFEINRANWDAWAAAHGQQDAYYDVPALVGGADSLTDVERAGVAAAVGDVRGLDVVHVQCHLAFDAINLARRGARVTAVDFSPVALAKAATIAADCGVEVEFVEADATRLPGALRHRFDLAYATIGILCWIGDVDAWMRSVASVLRPGGRLLLIDGHPMMGMIGTIDPLSLEFPYTYDGPHEFSSPASYAGVAVATRNVQYGHSLGEIVSAAIAAGLRVLRLTEHMESPIDFFGGRERDLDGQYRLRVTGQLVPQLFTLICERPAD